MPSLRRSGRSLTAADVRFLVGWFGARNDLRSVNRIRRQHTVVAHQIQSRRRHQSRQLLQQFFRGQHDLIRTVGPNALQREGDRVRIKDLQTAGGQG